MSNGKASFVTDSNGKGGRRKNRTQFSANQGRKLFVKYAEEWLEQQEGLVARSTWEGYEIYVVKHIIPFFKDFKVYLDEFSQKHVKLYCQQAKAGGNLSTGGRLSMQSIRKHAQIMKAIMESAVEDGYIDYNPLARMRIPGQQEPVREKRYLTAEEARKVIWLFKGTPLEELVLVTLYYGLRRSEVLGLRWSAIDFDKKTIAINHTVVKNVTIEAKDTTKTASSRRDFPLIDEVGASLLSLKRKQELQKELAGDKYNDTGYVFVREDGTLMRPDYLTRTFQKVVENNGFGHMRFHDLRHSTASILYEKGWGLKEIQMWLGHSDISVTADIYTHISNEQLRQKGVGLDGFLTNL